EMTKGQKSFWWLLLAIGIACALRARGGSGAAGVYTSTSATASGYNVYYGVASSIYTNKVNVGNVTNATISGLIEGTTYYFALTAYNPFELESDFSNEMFYTVPAP